ncbi:unnamed protein product [Bursaphelenchus okinawaensis]|uniref:Uncharacterized protein n=1 Tax=Bursaphelenchus okinawaensis TaxID=465554 RepID=A0A811JST7_9BILA|nr:unnamed protein product [Bursaphelenchus okinawaensis]CAG9080904.1 unnamed protein product [Bursaphelenchus okinawaensis]
MCIQEVKNARVMDYAHRPDKGNRSSGSAVDANILKCPKCSDRLEPLLLDTKGEGNDREQTIWWTCKQVANRKCNFPLNMPTNVYWVTRNGFEIDREYIPLPKIYLLPPNFQYLYPQTFPNSPKPSSASFFSSDSVCSCCSSPTTDHKSSQETKPVKKKPRKNNFKSMTERIRNMETEPLKQKAPEESKAKCSYYKRSSRYVYNQESKEKKDSQKEVERRERKLIRSLAHLQKEILEKSVNERLGIKTKRDCDTPTSTEMSVSTASTSTSTGPKEEEAPNKLCDHIESTGFPELDRLIQQRYLKTMKKLTKRKKRRPRPEAVENVIVDTTVDMSVEERTAWEDELMGGFDDLHHTH